MIFCVSQSRSGFVSEPVSSRKQELQARAKGRCRWLGLSMLLLALSLAGCKSPPSTGKGSLAWVELPNQTPKQICEVTKTVFVEKGYRFVTRSGAEMIFEKAGGFTTSLLHGGLDRGAVLRVFVGLDVQPNGIWLLHCRADAVRGAGETLEDSQHLSRLHSGSLKSLLTEIKARLARV
jgi:hypothetical protein